MIPHLLAGPVEFTPAELAVVVAILILAFLLLLAPGAALCGVAALSRAGAERRWPRFVGGLFVGYLAAGAALAGATIVPLPGFLVVLGAGAAQVVAAAAIWWVPLLRRDRVPGAG